MKTALFRMMLLSVLCVSALAQMEIVDIEKPEPAKSVAGVVSDPTGSPLPGVTVEERSDDWITVLRKTETDERGRFRFSTSPNKSVYKLQFSRSGFNWVRIKVRLDKKAAPSISVKMPLGT